jgi:hypothetical protein
VEYYHNMDENMPGAEAGHEDHALDDPFCRNRLDGAGKFRARQVTDCLVQDSRQGVGQGTIVITVGG